VLNFATPPQLLRNPQRRRDVRDRAAPTDQFQRLPPELLRVGRPCLGHRCPSFQRRFRRKHSGLRKIGGIPYFPKGFDFSTVTEAQLDAVADELNERPRKRFGFATPTEQLSELLLQ
jgi:hypothetical protein